MHFKQERIEEFCRLYKKAYGEDISADDARYMARRLIGLYRLLKQLDERADPQAGPAQSALEAS